MIALLRNDSNFVLKNDVKNIKRNTIQQGKLKMLFTFFTIDLYYFPWSHGVI